MKTFLILAILLLAVACGKGGGGSSSGSGGGNNAVADFSNRAVSNYELRVNGCNTSTFTAIAFTDPGTADEVRHDVNGYIDNTGTTNIVVSGKAIEWEVTSLSGGCALDMQLTRNTNGAIFIATDSIPTNGQTGFISDI